MRFIPKEYPFTCGECDGTLRHYENGCATISCYYQAQQNITPSTPACEEWFSRNEEGEYNENKDYERQLRQEIERLENKNDELKYKLMKKGEKV